MRLQDVSARSIEDFKRLRSHECANAGVNRDLACLRTFLNWCVRMGHLGVRPYIKLLPEDSHRMRVVSYEEERVYMREASPELRAIVTVLIETGLRPNELWSLKPEFIHPGYVHVQQGKTKYARRNVPLTEKASAILAMGLPQISHQVALRRHKKLLGALGIPEVRLYDFRHTFGTRMAMAGVDLMTLREIMGHSTITITQRYCHPTPEHKCRAIEQLQEYNGAQAAGKQPQEEVIQ